MRMLFAVCTLMLTCALGACSSEDAGCGGDARDRAFGACCTASEQCSDGVCHTFGSGARLCTMKCPSADACPAGSEGKKCNGQGVCKP